MVETQDYQPYLNLLEQTLKGIDTLISLPEVYLKFRRLMDDPESTNQDFSDLISCDPNLAATVLKLANSPIYGLSGKVGTVSRAIHFLGIKRLHEIAVANVAMSLDYPNEIVPLKSFWRSSLFSGVLARLLAERSDLEDSEGLFLIGLLHQLGQLVIYSKYPDQAKKAILSAKETRRPVAAAEQRILGFHYGHVGAKLITQWRLPVSFSIIIYFQPTPLDAPANRLETALLHLVHGYAQSYLDREVKPEQGILPEVWDILNITPEQVQLVFEQAALVSADIEKTIIKY